MADTERKAIHYRWDDIELEHLSDSISRRLVTADRMMLAHVLVQAR